MDFSAGTMMQRHSIYDIDAPQQILLRVSTTFEATRVVVLIPHYNLYAIPKKAETDKKYAHSWQLHRS